MMISSYEKTLVSMIYSKTVQRFKASSKFVLSDNIVLNIK